MNAQEKEKYYDDVIAPQLAAIAKDCYAKGLSFVAVAEWAPRECGRTASIQAGAGFGVLNADMAIRANGNLDTMMMGVIAHARAHGHSSAYLTLLKVPTEPEPAGDAPANPD